MERKLLSVVDTARSWVKERWHGERRRAVRALSLQGELLGAEHLAERAREVAAGQVLVEPRTRGRSRTPLLDALEDTRAGLAEAHARVASAAEAGADVGPAGEWLLDNNYVMQEHFQRIRSGLPPGYYRELPVLASGPLAGHPRVYEIATTLIAHSEARVNTDSLKIVLTAFQSIVPLRIGELWALPSMLGLGLLESVERTARRSVERLDQVAEAKQWAQRLTRAARTSGSALGAALGEFMAEPPPLTAEFVSVLLRRLRPLRGSHPPLVWLEQWIGQEALSAEEAATRAGQRLAVAQVVMSNSVTSLRTISRLDWRDFVEQHSRMEQVLREDPSGFHERMTFETRDSYRHVVEALARRTHHSEETVARAAIELAKSAAAGGGDPSVDARGSHVGYYLVDTGRVQLERQIGYRRTPGQAARRLVLRHPDAVLVGGLVLGTALLLGLTLLLAGDAAGWPWIVLVTLLPATDIAVSVFNVLVAAILPPDRLPSLEFRSPGGIPEQARTAVVVPTLFDDVTAVQEALEHIEAQFLANRQPHLHFALLSDFTDAAAETCPDDDAILAAAASGVKALNQRYANGDDAFFLFHRPRRWNPGEGVWMGWERKRGKLGDFNRFLRGGSADAFCLVVGDVTSLRDVRYVITLDADTVLPPDAAPRLIGTMAHPLNRPVFDERRGRVVRGYGILQPRVEVSLPSAHRSRFAALFSGHPGVDPYSTASSDVYQDLFREGSYTGKGIYDVDAFERATRGRFAENTLLSHDLIEGSYARAGLATDIQVYDDYPASYLTWTRRRHRWIRGDWQLIGWLLPAAVRSVARQRVGISMLSRWKITDNLRRSTVELAQLALFLAGWLFLPGSPVRWTLVALTAVAAPWIVALLLAALRPPLDRSWRAYYASLARDAGLALRQVGLAVAFLPHQALVAGDAIGRTLWRLLITRRNLLEWRTASLTERSHARTSPKTWREMGAAVVLALGIASLVLTLALFAGDVSADRAPAALLVAAAPILAVWLAAPVIAQWLNAPALRPRHSLSHADRAAATRYALLHWRYFDHFVNAGTRHLAPDNFQEDLEPVLAMRTSPTNIGLQLLATASACDLGFITPADMVQRLEHAFDSLAQLPRAHGHFFNWYDLHDLRVLDPPYISTVDSGNLAGHLIALRQACLAASQTPQHGGALWRGVEGALALADARLASLGSDADEPARLDLALSRAALQGVRRASTQLAALRAAVAQRRDPDVSPDSLRVGLDAVLTTLSAARLPASVAAAATEWLQWTRTRLETAAATPPPDLGVRLQRLAEQADQYVSEMDFGFLYDPTRKLLSIGYDAHAHELDASFYDLLASEARLASFLAIAKNDVPVEHWFRLGRSLTHSAGATALVSWSGSMFEYLMPMLVMRSFPATLLAQTYEGAVRRQIAYGARRRVPWGVSESAYNVRDAHFTYQYHAFGVPDLGLQRGLAQDLVIAPYASALALMVAPAAALSNLATLSRMGALGPYGFRDALDFTRPDQHGTCAVVGSYMAHHVGMSLVALTNLLCDDTWQERFHADPAVRATELLLYERIPRLLVLQQARAARVEEGRRASSPDQAAIREFTETDTPRPHIALLGYTPYTVMISHCGAGSSTFEDLAVTRWQRDGTLDHTGQFCYVRDVESGRTWSAAHQPVCARADRYHAELATDHVSFQRTDGTIETRMEVAVVPQDAAEIRRVTVVNNGTQPRVLELTSYGEIVLGDRDADAAHPAFSKLFIETEYHDWCQAVTATRRPRSAGERRLWCVHVVATGRSRVGPLSFETDRALFVGRGRTTRNPVALERNGPLSGSRGAVLDPIFSLRTRVRLEPGQSATTAFTTIVATSRERAFELADRYRHLHAARRALDLAWTATHVELRELKVTSADAAVFQELAGHMLYPDGLPAAPARPRPGSQPLLWQAGISGDLPVLLARIDSTDGLPTLRQLLAAHHFWRRHGLRIDLVVLNTHAASYIQELDDAIHNALSAASGSGITDQPGGVYVRRPELLSTETLLMLESTAAVHISCDGPALAASVQTDGVANARLQPSPRLTTPVPSRDRGRSPQEAGTQAVAAAPVEPLFSDNGYGGLAPGGEYVMRVGAGRVPPSPWSNVIANPAGGFTITERGAGFTWAGSSYAFRLTPWHNDPVSDVPGEVLFLRDEDSGHAWCPTPSPLPTELPYRVTHGSGYSTFEHARHDIATDLTVGMAADHAVKLFLLRLTNHGDRNRRITMTAYVEWVLGVLRKRTRQHVHTWTDPQLAAAFAQNRFDAHYADWVAFCALSEPLAEHTSDRREFIGRNGSLSAPAALHAHLTGATGLGVDPCAALRCLVELKPGESRELAIVLGAMPDAVRASEAVAHFSDVSHARTALGLSTQRWQERLSTITVHTPEPAFDVMVNRWALYQALSCRMWARTALYQNSGAYGFRDQLQDVMAFVHAEPGIAREHILRAASRQFVEGDVQHWWHPHSGRGVRTRFSDDLAWLPYVVEHYTRSTGDDSVLDEVVPFLHMRSLTPTEDEAYDLPLIAAETASLYEHCTRALRRACTAGTHGLPLIGTGDWNDGMNRVGAAGRGESIWLAWFLTATLRAFAPLARARRDPETAEWCERQAASYAAAVEANGWDGAWYRRAYYDDGATLGSAGDAECRIDSIAQSWSVLSGAGDPARQRRAMASLREHLVRIEERIILLLDPPFDAGDHDPGYIRGYLPGVRENGAQYTHAALWAVQAAARLGDGEQAFELFQLLNPLLHAQTDAQVQRYRVEPYVIAADVYSSPTLSGRGGWTWYTGSASWFYRVALEDILGFSRRGDRLSFTPCVPASWPAFSVEYRYGSTTYRIDIASPATLRDVPVRVLVDGSEQPGDFIQLIDDGRTRHVQIAPA